MERKWRSICGVQTQLLFIFLWIAHPAFAKPAIAEVTKKGKAGVLTKTSKSAPSTPKAVGATTLAPTSGKKGAKKQKHSVSSKISKQSSSRNTKKASRRSQSATVAKPAKKGEKAVARKSAAKTSRLIKSRRATQVSKRRQGRKTSTSASKKALVSITREPTTRRELLLQTAASAETAARYSPEIAPFLIQVNDEQFLHRINSAFALPEETMRLSVDETSEKDEYVVQTTLATVQTGPNSWTWKAPRKVGLYPVTISPSDGGATVQLNVFVMAPLALAKGGSLNDYRIGHYPTTARGKRAALALPRGFIEVTEENENTLVSPHFRLRQFLCKQESAYPKYIALDPRLLIVLEAILLKINERGHHTPTLSIMSGYRTPYYNRAIGNSTTYSRHLWGDAADIFVDSNPPDGEMDDFNNDGVINIRDTEVLHSIVSEMYQPRAQRVLTSSFFSEPILQKLVMNGYTDETPLQKLLTGGLARYRATSSHGPFVHVDVRGIFTRWGR